MTTEDFRIPGGLIFRCRPETSDVNSAISCAYEDAYGLRNYDLAGKLVFDIGAHVGGVAMLAASLGAKAIAVEPVPENAELIRASAALNDLDVTVVEMAAGAPGTMEMSYGWKVSEGWEGRKDEPTATVHAFIGNTGIGAEEGYEPAHKITVECVTLARLVGRYGMPYLIKLDCEGGEWPLLAEPCMAGVEVITGEYHPWIGDQLLDQASYFQDNVAEVKKRIGGSHDLSFHGPDGMDAGHFLGIRKH